MIGIVHNLSGNDKEEGMALRGLALHKHSQRVSGY